MSSPSPLDEAGGRTRAELLGIPESPHEGLTPGVVAVAVAPVLAAAAASLIWHEGVARRAGFVWLLALIPIFLLAYRQGWRGAALALALGMVAFVFVEVVGRLLLDFEVDVWAFGLVTAVLVAAALGAGWVSERLVSERRRTLERALGMALEDPETGLPTRRAAELFLAKEFAAARRGGELSVVLFDLDGFADFVERHGRGLSRQVLRQIGEVFRETSREADLSGRWGSQEFLAVLPDEDREGAGTFAERVRKKADLVEIRAADGSVVSSGITLSAGVAAFAGGMEEASTLLERAHRALHAAKAKGGDSVVLFDPSAEGGVPSGVASEGVG